MSARALQLAARHLRLDQMPGSKRQRLTIFQSSLTYRDDRLTGLDAAVLMEVIEHLDPERLPALERATFGFAAPATVIEPSPLELAVPELSLVVLVGVTGSGKSTFARAHFRPTEVISSDFCRGLVADDENDQAATPAAFELLHYIAGKRLAAGRLTVIDATNVQPEARRELVLLAREHDVLPVAIVLDLPEKLCAERNAQGRGLGAHVLRRQRGQLRRGLHYLAREGFRTVHVLRTPEQVAAAAITRTRLFSDLRHESGPFDVIGDVHGCRAELEQLLTELGYTLEHDAADRPARRPPPGGQARRLRRQPGRPGPGHAWRAAPGHGHGGGRDRVLRGRQPRGQAGQGAARQEC